MLLPSTSLVGALQTTTKILDMTYLVNEFFYFLDSFNVDLRVLYNLVYNLFCIRSELLHNWVTFHKLSFGEEALTEL